MLTNFLILRPFNGMFILLCIIFGFITYGIYRYLKDEPRRKKRTFLAILYTGVLILLIVYKIFLSHDAEYSMLSAANGEGEFHWGAELPLHLCNINIILMIIACILNSDRLYNFIFYIAVLGALLAMLMPSVGMSGYSILLPRMWGFWLTHFFVIIETPLVALLGFVKPKFKDIPTVTLTMAVLATIIFCIDVTFRATGIGPTANYFYLVDTTGNPILDIFYRMIPVKGLYILPGFPILMAYMAIVNACYSLSRKIHKDNLNKRLAKA